MDTSVLSPTMIKNLPSTQGGLSQGSMAPGPQNTPYGGWSATPGKQQMAQMPQMPSGGSVTFNAHGRTQLVEEKSVTVSDQPEMAAAAPVTGTVSGSGAHPCGNKGYEGGYAWVVWLFLIFIIIVLIIMAIFWYTRPSWATNTCEQGGEPTFNTCCAGAYAFGIALFFIIILVAIWCCAGGRR